MEYTLRQFLKLTDEEIENSKIELNMTKGSKGKPFIDIWLRINKKDKEHGNCLDCSYWSERGSRGKAGCNFKEGETIFSFVRMCDNDWLLVSVGTAIKIIKNGRPFIKFSNKYKPLYGRLIIKLNKGNTYSRFTFNLKKFIDKAVVKEILPNAYDGDKFNGYDQISIPYSKLADIFNQKVSPTYYEALNKITGIYCLTDKKNGKLYIGSATGKGGVAQRWGNYFETKHGGNKKLIRLKETKGEKYFEKYFIYSVIEYFGLSYDVEKIKEREQYWKKCFATIENGYNDN